MKKIAWIAAVVIALVALDWYVRAPDSRSRELTRALAEQGGAEMKAYPYQFRVLKVEGDVAYVTTPRSFDVPAARMISALYSEINTRNADDPAFVAAQQTLARIQGEAQQIVASQPGVTSVRWQLDRDWLVGQHIDVPDGAGP